MVRPRALTRPPPTWGAGPSCGVQPDGLKRKAQLTPKPPSPGRLSLTAPLGTPAPNFLLLPDGESYKTPSSPKPRSSRPWRVCSVSSRLGPSLPQSLTFGPGGLGRRRRCCGSGPPGSRPRPARPPACPPLRFPDHGPGRRPGPGGTWPVPKLAATRATTAPSSSAAPSTRRHADYLRIVAGLECIALSCAGY